MHQRISSIPKKEFVNGNQALYLHSRVYDGDKFTYWCCLDVESPDAHDDIAENIAVAQDILTIIIEKGLKKGLSILLTGSGFRFEWPYYVSQDYKRGYAAWCRDMGGVDLKANGFFRMLGYRGNTKQAKKCKDVHIHKLDDLHDLWFLTADEYQELVKGKPDYKQSMSWIDSILPQHEIPDEWKQVLDDWKIHEELKACAIVPEYFHKEDKRDTFKQIKRYLKTQGIERREQNKADFWFWKLSSCPECGRKDGATYITSNGRLKCFHATCLAGERDLEGNIKGLSPYEYINHFEAGCSIDISPECSSDFSDSEESRRQVTFSTLIEKEKTDLSRYRTVQEARESFNGITTHDTLRTDDPGVGKTTSTIEQLVPECVEQKILYSSPTKKLNGQTYDDAEEIGKKHGVNVFTIEGRSEDNCLQYARANHLTLKGFKPGAMLCPGCKHKGFCKYLNQFEALNEKTGFFITTHAQLNHIKLNFDRVIIDEDPRPSFFHQEIIPFDSILKFQSISDGAFFEKLQRVAKAMTKQ